MTLQDIRAGLTPQQIQAAQDFNDKYFGANKSEEPFRSDLTVNWAGDPSTLGSNPPATSSPINPNYCATSTCAYDMQALLSQCGISSSVTQGSPLGNWPSANDFSQSGTVPYLAVSGLNTPGQQVTVSENAGQLAEAFGHGYPPADALATVLDWIQMDLQAVAPSQ